MNAMVGRLFDALLRQSSDCALLIRTGGAVLRANPAACRALGRTEEEISRQGSGGLVVHDADLAQLVAERDRASVGPGRVTFRRPDGSAFLAEFTSAVIATEGSDPSTFIIFRDLTEERSTDVSGRNLAEEALRESEGRMVRVLEGSFDGFGDFNAATGFVSVTPRYCEIYGLPPHSKEISVEALMALVEPEDLPPIQADMAVIGAGGKDAHLWEYRIRRADGATRWIRSRGKVLGRDASGRPVHVSGAITDITEQKEAEAALAASERRYRSLIDVSPNAILTVRDGRVEIVNRALVEATGYDRPEELVGRPVLDLLAPETRERSRERMATVLAGGQVGIAEIHVVRRDGSIRLMESAATLCPDERGPVIQVALRDITEQRTMQEQLQVASRLAALGTLVAGVAHEINNPLAGTMSGQGMAIEYLRELRERASRKDAVGPDALVRDLDEHLDALEDAQAGAQRIARIVRDLVTLGHPSPRRERVRVVDVVNDTMRWLPASVASSITIQVESRDAPDVVASAGQMGQVLLNLITNAASSIPGTAPGIITVRVGPGRPGTACVEVADNGSGMAPQVMARVFDPFFTTRTVGQGTGLGLSISHAIVTAHGGTITAASEAGKGSTFRIELPAAPVVE